MIEPTTASDSIRNINLNLPPEGGASKLPQSTEVLVSQYPQPIDMNVAPPTVEGVFLDTCSSSCTVPEPMKPVVDDEPPKKEQANLVNDGLLINPDGSAASVPPTAPASSTVTVTYPIIDLTAEPLEAPVRHPSVTKVPPVPTVVSDKEAVENALLKELDDMGFSQVNLNKEILRMNEYDLERSVDDLCGVADWDPILEELNEMVRFHPEQGCVCDGFFFFLFLKTFESAIVFLKYGVMMKYRTALQSVKEARCEKAYEMCFSRKELLVLW